MRDTHFELCTHFVFNPQPLNQIPDRIPMHSFPRGGAGVGIVRSQHDVIHFQERTIQRQRLDFKDIQCGARETLRLQRGDQRFLATMGPRAVLMRTADGFICARVFALMR